MAYPTLSLSLFFSHPIAPNVLDFQYSFGILERKSVGKEEGN